MLLCSCGIGRVTYLEKETRENLRETVDFIQLWYCKKFTADDWEKHISGLEKQGYSAIILQSTCEFDENGFLAADDSGNVFPDETVNALLAVAEKKDFGVYLGLASSDLWWKTKLYRKNADRWGNFQAEAAELAYKAGKNYKSFKGFYMPFEMYTNPFRYEKYWAETCNVLIGKLNELAPGYPLILSPYKSGLYKMSKRGIYDFAERLFSSIDFREYDIVAPQDGSGNAAPGFTVDTEREVNEFLSAFYTAAERVGKCRFGVNIEFFTCEKNRYAKESRIKRQREIANRYASVILSFSYSHYFAPEIGNG